jgi:hypothetical protein
MRQKLAEHVAQARHDPQFPAGQESVVKEDLMKRYKERLRLNSSVTFRVGSQVGHGRVLNLTLPGCLIQSPMRVKNGDSLQLEMMLPELKLPLIVILGVVRWTKGTQIGVEFIRMDASQQLTLRVYLAHYLGIGARIQPAV